VTIGQGLEPSSSRESIAGKGQLGGERRIQKRWGKAEKERGPCEMFSSGFSRRKETILKKELGKGILKRKRGGGSWAKNRGQEGGGAEGTGKTKTPLGRVKREKAQGMCKAGEVPGGGGEGNRGPLSRNPPHKTWYSCGVRSFLRGVSEAGVL